jgi:predicted nucleic acid-binding protein
MYLLDTNVLSELRRADRSDASVRTWSKTMQPERFFLSAITILEIEQGILRLQRRDAKTAELFRDWLINHVLKQFDGRILAFDLPAALRCAAMHVPDPKPERDSMIAATASLHGLTVATRNVADFEACGVPVVNPWLYPA